MALGHIHLRFSWQAWRLWHWAGSGGALGLVLVAGDAAALCVAVAWHLVTSTFVWRGRHGTWSHPPSFCVAGVALNWAGSGGALGLVLVASDAAALCVAGVTLGHIHLRFAWQAWHLWHWAGSGVTRPIFVTHHLCHTTSFSHTIFHATCIVFSRYVS